MDTTCAWCGIRFAPRHPSLRHLWQTHRVPYCSEDCATAAADAAIHAATQAVTDTV